MRTKQKIKLLLQTLALSVVLIVSCVEFEPVSPIPEIKYVDFDFKEGIDTALGNIVRFALLEFEFIDGDADFGIYQEVWEDPNETDSARFNLFMTVYDKIDGIYTPKLFWNDSTNKFDTLTLKQGILHDYRMDRVGQNKTVKGKITSNTQFTKWDELQDTFRIEFYILDRAQNKSNTEYTDDYFVDQSGGTTILE